MQSEYELKVIIENWNGIKNDGLVKLKQNGLYTWIPQSLEILKMS